MDLMKGHGRMEVELVHCHSRSQSLAGLVSLSSFAPWHALVPILSCLAGVLQSAAPLPGPLPGWWTEGFSCGLDTAHLCKQTRAFMDSLEGRM